MSHSKEIFDIYYLFIQIIACHCAPYTIKILFAPAKCCYTIRIRIAFEGQASIVTDFNQTFQYRAEVHQPPARIVTPVICQMNMAKLVAAKKNRLAPVLLQYRLVASHQQLFPL